jgi:hypothetical protein
VAKLEYHLRITGGKALLVGDAAAQDEGVVVEPEVGRIQNSTSRIWRGALMNSLVENLTPLNSAGRRISLAKSKKLLRDVKWFGRRMSLHSRNRT